MHSKTEFMAKHNLPENSDRFFEKNGENDQIYMTLSGKFSNTYKDITPELIAWLKLTAKLFT
jgi:hypothetical protein